MWTVSRVCYWCVCCLEALLGKSIFSVPLNSGGCEARERGCDRAGGGHGFLMSSLRSGSQHSSLACPVSAVMFLRMSLMGRGSGV